MGKKVNVDINALKEFCEFLQEHPDEKTQLVKFIAEKRGIKEASARRNINRMINYYLRTGKQSRSGKEYIPLIQEYLQTRYDNTISLGEFVGEFVNYDMAKEYTSDIPVLHIHFTPDFMPYVWRDVESV